MIKEKLKRGSLLYKIYLIYHLFVRYKIFLRKRKSFSQFGEDTFINEFFKDKVKGKYVDLGAFHPIRLNNTYLLYKRGWSGTNIDFNPTSIDMFNLVRKRDHNICSLISDKDGEKRTAYFQHDWSAGNTTILDEDFKKVLKKEKTMISKTFENLITHDFDFLNIDLEGHDYNVLKTINLKKYNPKLICIEILAKSKDGKKIFKHMEENSFIFVKKCDVSYFFKKEKNENY